MNFKINNEIKVVALLSGFTRELNEGADYLETNYKYTDSILKVFNISNIVKRINKRLLISSLFGLAYMLFDLIRYLWQF